MRFLAAWLANPSEYWVSIVFLLFFVTITVWGFRKVRSRSRQ